MSTMAPIAVLRTRTRFCWMMTQYLTIKLEWHTCHLMSDDTLTKRTGDWTKNHQEYRPVPSPYCWYPGRTPPPMGVWRRRSTSGSPDAVSGGPAWPAARRPSDAPRRGWRSSRSSGSCPASPAPPSAAPASRSRWAMGARRERRGWRSWREWSRWRATVVRKKRILLVIIIFLDSKAPSPPCFHLEYTNVVRLRQYLAIFYFGFSIWHFKVWIITMERIRFHRLKSVELLKNIRRAHSSALWMNEGQVCGPTLCCWQPFVVFIVIFACIYDVFYHEIVCVYSLILNNTLKKAVVR